MKPLVYQFNLEDSATTTQHKQCSIRGSRRDIESNPLSPPARQIQPFCRFIFDSQCCNYQLEPKSFYSWIHRLSWESGWIDSLEAVPSHPALRWDDKKLRSRRWSGCQRHRRRAGRFGSASTPWRPLLNRVHEKTPRSAGSKWSSWTESLWRRGGKQKGTSWVNLCFHARLIRCIWGLWIITQTQPPDMKSHDLFRRNQKDCNIDVALTDIFVKANN